MNEKHQTNISYGSLGRKITIPGDDDPEESSESSALSKRIKLDRKITFAVKTSNEQNQDVEMAENCTLRDLKLKLKECFNIRYLEHMRIIHSGRVIISEEQFQRIKTAEIAAKSPKINIGLR